MKLLLELAVFTSTLCGERASVRPKLAAKPGGSLIRTDFRKKSNAPALAGLWPERGRQLAA
jgi:hypothetical protein